MKSAFPLLALASVFLTTAATATLDDLNAKYQPNYSTRLLPPYEGYEAKPELVREWKSFPVRVAVLDDDDLYSEAAFQTIRRACERWVAATRSTPGGGVAFTYEHGAKPYGAQIVVRLRRRGEMGGYIGLTLPQDPRWQYIQIAVTDSHGGRIGAERFEMIATHEIGHALGITGHSPDAGDVMSLKCKTPDISSADANTLKIAYGGRFRK